MTYHVLKCLTNDCLDVLSIVPVRMLPLAQSVGTSFFRYSSEPSTEDEFGSVAREIVVDNCLK